MRGLRLFALLMVTGIIITFIHDYAYRRVDRGEFGDYEFGGLISHAGTDMLTIALILAGVAGFYTRSRKG